VGVLQRFERRLEGLVSHAFTRVFKGQVEPVEVAAQLQRETDDRKTVVGEGRILVPNAFVVELGTTDYERLSPYAGPLGAELADMVSEHAAEQGYSFVGPVRVILEHAEALDTGRFLVRSGVAAAGGAASAVPATPSSAARPSAVPPPPSRAADNWGRPLPPGEPGPAAGSGAPAWLDVEPRSGDKQTLVLNRPVTVIGRSPECELALEDTGVSRRHAEIRLGSDGVTLTDLGSTNGTSVNGKPIGSRELVDGDRVVVGTTTLIFRRHGQ
jgi:hypothetical protein